MTEAPPPHGAPAPSDLRWVIDTNVIVSGAFWPTSVPGAVLRLAMQTGATLLFTESTLAELQNVLLRPRFDRYARREDRQRFIADLLPLAHIVPPSAPIRACRDPKDDKVLEAAVHGGASALVTVDADLLVLHPFLGVPILQPADFMALLAAPPESPHQVNEPRARYGRKSTAQVGSI